MKPLDTIVAATDLSAPARHAVARALRIACANRSDCTVVHAPELDALDSLREWLGEDLTEVKQRLQEGARQALAAQVPAAAAECARAVLLEGPALQCIAAEVQARSASLLVLGARGGHFLRHTGLGSMASRLLRKVSACPVLLVKQVPHEDYRRVLVAVDFSRSGLTAIRYARALAPGADIVLLHAFEAPFESKLAFAGVEPEVMQRYRAGAKSEALYRVRQLAGLAGLEAGAYTPMVLHGDPASLILEQEQASDADLIVVGKHGQNVVEELLLGSVAKHVVSASQADVLVVGEQTPPWPAPAGAHDDNAPDQAAAQ